MPVRWIFIYLILPFGALIQSLKSYRHPAAKNLFWLFCIYLGFVFVIPSDVVGAADAARYAAQLAYAHAQNMTLDNLVAAIYNPIDGYVDVYQPLATFIVSSFTENPQWLFALFAFVFGYFFSRNIWMLLKLSHNRKITSFALLVIIGFALLNPIWNINGVRMWTAAQIFVYGVLLFYLEQKKSRGIIWIVSTMLVHFTFIFPIAIFISYLLLPKNRLILFALFIATSFIKEIDIYQVRNFLSFMPDIFQPRIEGYTNIEYYETYMNRDFAWHVTFTNFARSFVVYSMAVIIFLNYKITKDNKILPGLFLLSLYLGSWTNLSALIPSGGRFMVLSNILMFASFFLFLQLNTRVYQFSNLKNIIMPFLIFFIIFNVRVGLDYLGVLHFFGNPFIGAVITEQTPIINFIKDLLY